MAEQETPIVAFDAARAWRGGDDERSSARSQLPAIHEADIARWEGREPMPIVFASESLLPIGMVTLLAADGGAGKSMLQQISLTCIAAGLDFVGHRCLNGRAAGIFCEDPENVLHLRQDRINRKLGVDYLGLAKRVFVQSYAGMDATLWRDGRPTHFMKELETNLSRIDDLKLVCIDNAAMVYADDESDRPNVTRFMGHLAGIAERLGTAMLLSAHTSKSSDKESRSMASGSTAWVWASRSALLLSPANPKKNEAPKLDLMKANHTQPGKSIRLKWEDAVLLPDMPSGGLFGAIERRGAEQTFLDLLVAVQKEGRMVSENTRAGNYAPKFFAERPDANGYSKSDFKYAMEGLFKQGKIEVIQYGRKGDERRRIEVKKAAVPAEQNKPEIG